jgi:TetR/AcrR family transcriptional regulator, lmrAB and yxaGH operons repressor
MSITEVNPRERFLAATQTLLRQGGLAAAGLNDVVALAQAPKGSLYHYFPQGKHQMVALALDGYRELVAEQLRLALHGSDTLPRRVTRLFDQVARRMAASGFQQSCAVGAVVLDLRPPDEGLRRVCNAALDHWAGVAAAGLPELPAAQRAAAGRVLVSLLEGAQLAARAAGHAGPLADAAAAFLGYARAPRRPGGETAAPARSPAAPRRRPSKGPSRP